MAIITTAGGVTQSEAQAVTADTQALWQQGMIMAPKKSIEAIHLELPSIYRTVLLKVPYGGGIEFNFSATKAAVTHVNCTLGTIVNAETQVISTAGSITRSASAVGTVTVTATDDSKGATVSADVDLFSSEGVCFLHKNTEFTLAYFLSATGVQITVDTAADDAGEVSTIPISAAGTFGNGAVYNNGDFSIPTTLDYGGWTEVRLPRGLVASDAPLYMHIQSTVEATVPMYIIKG
jgi:hypothetical protein